MTHPMIDGLDPRLLLAAFATLNSRGTLSIVGGATADQIVVERAGASIRARLNGQSMSFAGSAVKRIWCKGFGDGDRIENRTTALSFLDFGIDARELDAGVIDFHLPFDSLLPMVRIG